MRDEKPPISAAQAGRVVKRAAQAALSSRNAVPGSFVSMSLMPFTDGLGDFIKGRK